MQYTKVEPIGWPGYAALGEGRHVKTRRVRTEDLKPGMILAVNIYSHDRKLLLVKRGLPLSKDLIYGLMRRKIPSVPVEERTSEPGKTLKLPLPHDAKRKDGISFTYPASIEERIFLNYNGKMILKIDDPIIETTKRKAVQTAHDLLIDIARKRTIDINSARDTAKEMIRAISVNKEAFMNISGMRMIDEYTFEHSVNVTAYSTIIARDFRLKGKELEAICTGALLHDVGKMLINPDILNKPGTLTQEEFEEMKTHPMKGYEILKENGIDENIALVAKGHHERCDGSGYPGGLTCEDMPYSMQITAIADVYDALTSDRVYKKSIASNNAMIIIIAESGKHFNSELVGLFQRMIGIYPIGSLVRLDNGCIARVLEQNEGIVRPIIQLLTNANGKQLRDRVVINLMDNTDVYIVESYINKIAA